MDKLSGAQKEVVIITIAILFIMGLFPPWLFILDTSKVKRSESGGYCFIFSAPERDTNLGRYMSGTPYTSKIDFTRLFLQWFLVLLLSSGFLLFFHWKKRKKTFFLPLEKNDASNNPEENKES